MYPPPGGARRPSARGGAGTAGNGDGSVVAIDGLDLAAWCGLDAVPIVKYLVLVNPLVYVAEGMRGALTPQIPHMHLGVVLVALLVVFGVFWVLGLRSFLRRAVG